MLFALLFVLLVELVVLLLVLLLFALLMLFKLFTIDCEAVLLIELFKNELLVFEFMLSCENEEPLENELDVRLC